MTELYDNLIDLEGKVSPAILSGIVNLNVSLLYQMRQKGYLDKEVAQLTYREAIQQIVNHYKNKQELKLQKQEQEHEIRLKRQNNKLTLSMPETEDGVSLEAARLRQSIKLDAAKEERIWQTIAIERGEYVKNSEMAELVVPFAQSMREMLLAIAVDFPETQSKVDEVMDNLFKLGNALVEQAEQDKRTFVREMLETNFGRE